MTKNMVSYEGADIDLSGYTKPPKDPAATQVLLNWSQFSKITPGRGQASNWAKTADDADIVAVHDTRATDAAGIIHRRLVNTREQRRGRQVRRVHEYELLGYKLVGKGEAAAALALAEVQAANAAQRAHQASSIPGLEGLEVVMANSDGEPFPG